jgi:hypothetical protein
MMLLEKYTSISTLYFHEAAPPSYQDGFQFTILFEVRHAYLPLIMSQLAVIFDDYNNIISSMFMIGIRDELNLTAKLELFSDFNKFRQSSCGI